MKQNDAILQMQSFDPGQPGPILLNIQTLIEAVGQGIPTTSIFFALPIRCLADMNEQLSIPAVHKLKRPQLKSFPALAGLFLLLRASGLAVGKTKPKRAVVIDPIMRELWESLNPTEKYMSLVDVWLTKVNWSILGEGDHFGGRLQSDTQKLYFQLRDRITYVGQDRFNLLYGYELRVAANLLEQFGLVKMEYAAEVDEGKLAEVRSIERTDFGDAVFAKLGGFIGPPGRDGSFAENTLKPLFSQWVQSLQSSKPPFREGRYTIKISWSKVWRRLVAPATTSLEAVCDWMLRSFDFDHDHLFQFEYRAACGRTAIVSDPRAGEGEQFADEFRLGDLPLDEGDCFELLYDFGDSWKFKITIESIEDSVIEDFEPKITESYGEAPKQYGDEDVDW